VRNRFVFVCVAVLTSIALAQKTALPAGPGDHSPTRGVSADAVLGDMFEAKIKVEWDALKNKDKKTYTHLLAGMHKRKEVRQIYEMKSSAPVCIGNRYHEVMAGNRVESLPTDPDRMSALLVPLPWASGFSPGSRFWCVWAYTSVRPSSCSSLPGLPAR
jgi:hypothetical protein